WRGNGTATPKRSSLRASSPSSRSIRTINRERLRRKRKAMADQYDLIVLGSGPGGYVAAIRAAQLGLKTAIVERELLGGICLNWGCIPTKALLKSGEVFEQLSHLSDYGLGAEKPSFDFGKIVERSRGVSKQLNQGVAYLMKKHKIEVIEG